MSDKQISKNTKIIVIVSVFVALIAAVAIMFGLQSKDDTSTNVSDSNVTETAEPSEALNEEATGVVDLVMEKVEVSDSAVNLPQPDVNNPIPVKGYWTYVEDGKIIRHASGSSSCPPFITSASYNYETKVATLTEATYGNTNCTMDLAPIKQMIFLPDNTELPKDIKIEELNPTY